MSPAREPWPKALASSHEVSELERFYAHLALDDFRRDDAGWLDALCARSLVSERTRAHLHEQTPARLLVYRELVRKTHRRAITGAMPRAVARMEHRFDPLFSEFLATRATASRFLRDITWDFLHFCQTESKAGSSLPSYIFELGELEAVRIVVAAAPNPRGDVDFELDLERALAFSEATRVLRFQHAVHRLPDSEKDRTLPDELKTRLLVYRSQGHAVRYLELSELATLILEELMSGRALGPSVQLACERMGQVLDEATLAGAAQLLSDLAERKVILGVVPGS